MIDPRGLSVTDWADSMHFVLAPYVLAPRLDNPLVWQNWGLQILQAPAISQKNPPNPLQFGNWQEWAMRFNQAVFS